MLVEQKNFSVKVLPETSWQKLLSGIHNKSIRIAKKIREEGHHKAVEILAPTVIRSASEDMTPEEKEVPLALVTIDLDDPMLYTRLEIVKASIKTITESSTLGSLDPALPIILKSVIAGEGLYKNHVGEFFYLYGRFEERHKTTTGPATKNAMVKLLEGETEDYYKKVKVKDKNGVYTEWSHPLPYVVRNHLAHQGTDLNYLDQHGVELKTSIKLLKSWIGSDG